MDRFQAADEDPATVARLNLIAGIASVQHTLARQKAEVAASEGVLANLFSALEAHEKRQARLASALAPSTPLWLTLKEAAGLARCSGATMKAKARKHGFGERVDGRWRIVRDELVAYLTLGRVPADGDF